LASDAVVNASVAADAEIDISKLDYVGATQLGSAGMAQDDDLVMYDLSATANKRVTFSNFEDSIFGNVSGDATIAAGGALTIASEAVENSMLADDAVTAEELAASAVGAPEIVALGVGSAELQAGALTGDKMATNFSKSSGYLKLAAGSAFVISGTNQDNEAQDYKFSIQGGILVMSEYTAAAASGAAVGADGT